MSERTAWLWRAPRRTATAIAGSLILAANVTFAEPQNDPKNPSPNVSLTEQKINEAARISATDKKKNVEKMLVEIREALAKVGEMVKRVRTEGDMVKLNCVQEKEGQIAGLADLAEAASVRMYQAMGKGIAKQVNREYTTIVVAHQKAQIGVSDADVCKGKVDVEEPPVTEESSPATEEPDPIDPPDEPLGPVVPPVASPF